MDGVGLDAESGRTRAAALRGAALCFAGAFALYLLTFSPRAFALLWADDGMHYARWAVNGDPAELAHPHHILYHYAAWSLMQALAWLYGPGIETSLRAHQILSALGGAAGVAATFFLARRLGARAISSFAIPVFVATAFPYWGLSSVSETYAPEHAFVAALFATLVCERRSDALGARAWLPVALIVAGFAMREDMGLCLPAYALGVWSVHGWKKGTRRGALVAAVSLALIAAIYAVVYLAAVRGSAFDAHGFRGWLAGYQDDGRYGTFERYLEERMPLELEVLSVSVFPFWEAWLPASFAAIGAWIVPLLAALAFAGGLRRRGTQPLAFVAAAYFVSRLAFFAWWQAGYFEFDLGDVAALGFLFAAAAPGLRACAAWCAAAALFALAAVNAVHVATERFAFHRDEAAWARVHALERVLLPGETVVGLSTETRLGAMGYLGRDVLELEPLRYVAQIEEWLEAHRGRALFFPAADLAEIEVRPEWRVLGAEARERMLELRQDFQELFARENPPVVVDAQGVPLGWRFRRS